MDHSTVQRWVVHYAPQLEAAFHRNKHLARLDAIKIILSSAKYERLDTSLDFVPEHEIVISGPRELELMEAQRLKDGKFVG